MPLNVGGGLASLPHLRNFKPDSASSSAERGTYSTASYAAHRRSGDEEITRVLIIGETIAYRQQVIVSIERNERLEYLERDCLPGLRPGRRKQNSPRSTGTERLDVASVEVAGSFL